MAKKKLDILANNNQNLAIMYNGQGILVDESLLKYSSMKKELAEYKKSKAPKSTKLNSMPFEEDPTSEDVRAAFAEQQEMKEMLKNYETIRDGNTHQVNLFISKCAMGDILSSFNEYKISYVEWGNSNPTIREISEGDNDEGTGKTKKGFFGKLIDAFKFVSEEAKKEAEDVYTIDVLDFFTQIKGLTKSNLKDYVNRLSGYIIALKNCDVTGQTALKEKLLRDMVINKYESVLYAKGIYYVVTEPQVVDFVKKTRKGIRLTYMKNYMRSIPLDAIRKKEDADKLEIFDNYAILHYDPDTSGFGETIEETRRRRDPILFGLIKGSNKLYYITDWVDEYCDLTLDKLVEVLQAKKDDFKLEPKL